MNTKNENETPNENLEARTAPPAGDSRRAEPAPAPAQDGSDFRETPERGYGWGV